MVTILGTWILSWTHSSFLWLTYKNFHFLFSEWGSTLASDDERFVIHFKWTCNNVVTQVRHGTPLRLLRSFSLGRLAGDAAEWNLRIYAESVATMLRTVSNMAAWLIYGILYSFKLGAFFSTYELDALRNLLRSV